MLKFKEKRKKNQKSLESSESRRIFALSKTNKHFQTKKQQHHDKQNHTKNNGIAIVAKNRVFTNSGNK